jgi:peptidoglycan hydrolase-like protein with peptidoglycan-binding domain
VSRRIRLFLAMVVLCASILAAGAIGWNAGRRAISVSPSPPVPHAPVTIEVQAGELVVEQPMTVRLSWAVQRDQAAMAAGVVTRVIVPTGAPVEVHEGDVLYSLNELPAVVMRGLVPAFRDLSSGATGWDVVQLQQFLDTKGFFADEIDGNWASSTSKAVRSWQESLGVAATGDLPLGSIIFLDKLPQVVARSPQLHVGGVVTADTVTVSIVDPVPTATLILPGQLRGSLDVATFAVRIGVSTVEYRVGGLTRTDNATGETTAALVQSRTPVSCAEWCAEVPFGQSVSVAATATYGDPVSGAIVPVGVIESDGSTTYVVTAEGDRRTVVILLQADGQAVVTGISAGTDVIVPSGSE